MMNASLEIRKTYKLYIDGKFSELNLEDLCNG